MMVVIKSGEEWNRAVINWLHSNQELALFHIIWYEIDEKILFNRVSNLKGNKNNIESIFYTKLKNTGQDFPSKQLGEYDKKSDILIRYDHSLITPFDDIVFDDNFQWLLTHKDIISCSDIINWELDNNPKIINYSDLQKEIIENAGKELLSLCQEKYHNRKSLSTYKVTRIEKEQLDLAWVEFEGLFEENIDTIFESVSMQCLHQYQIDNWKAWENPLYIDYLRGDRIYLSSYGVPDLFEKNELELNTHQIVIRKSVEMAAAQGYHWVEKVKKELDYEPSIEAYGALYIYDKLTDDFINPVKICGPLRVYCHIKGRPVTYIYDRELKPTSFYFKSLDDIYEATYMDTKKSFSLFAKNLSLDKIDSIWDEAGNDMLYSKEYDWGVITGTVMT